MNEFDAVDVSQSEVGPAPISRRGFWGWLGFLCHAVAAGSFFSCWREEPEMKPIIGVDVASEPPAAPSELDFTGLDPSKTHVLTLLNGKLKWIKVSECD